MKNIALSFKNGIGNFIMLTPTIIGLQKMDYHVDILLDVPKGDLRYEPITDIINAWFDLGFYSPDKKYDEAFYIWGEGDRMLPKLNWKITKESESPFKYFLNGMHEVELYFKVAEKLGYYEKCEVTKMPPMMYCPVTVCDIMSKERNKKNICLHIGSRPEVWWKKKRWDNDNWVELLERLDGDVDTHMILSYWEKEDIDYIGDKIAENNIGSKGSLNIFHWNQPITEIAYLISQCDLMISTDSGPMHIAAAVNTPVIQLFGPTLPSKNKAWRANGVVLRDEKLECSPCLYTQRFGYCKDNKCMQNITVDMVMEHVDRYLKL
tara:strand:+ start:4646 stop:5608 length:963 start_codon:yes stop_codon:yes gene_type:complete